MSSDKFVSIHPILPLVFPSLSTETVSDEVDADSAWNYYSHEIQRNPKNLKSHTRRIFLAMQRDNASLLPGALQDLFIVLNNAGTQLRIRLLKASVPYLKKADIIYFATWIKTETTEQTKGFNWLPGSMLADGLLEPDKHLLSKKQAINKNKLSALEEARSCIEYGQLDLAKKILEDALKLDKDNPALKKELTEILKSIDTK